MLTAAVRVFSSAGWIPLHGTNSSSLLPVLTALCLLYIMMRIPWWISRPVLASFGPSPIRRAARFAFYAGVLSRVSPLLHGTAGARRPPWRGGMGGTPAGPRGGGPRGGGPGGRGPRGAAGTGGAGPGGAPGGTGGQPGGTPAAGGAGPGRGPSGPAPQRAGGRRRGPAGGAASRGGRLARQARGGPVPTGGGPAPGRLRQVQPPLPGMPPRPHTPRPGQRVLPFEVTRVPRGGAPGPRPVPAPPPARQPWAAGSRPQPPAPARHLPRPVPRVAEGDHR